MGNKKLCSILLIAALAMGIMNPTGTLTKAAAKIKLNKTSVTLNIGYTIVLKVKGTKKKATWISENTKVATVTQKGKVTAKSTGITKITAKIAKKKYTCTVRVKNANTDNSNSVAANSSNFDKLKTYIQNNGSVDADGYHFIEDTSTGIVCTLSYTEQDGMPVFMFLSKQFEENGSILYSNGMALTPVLSIGPVVSYCYTKLNPDNDEFSVGYQVKTNIDPKTFTKDTMLTFEVSDNVLGCENSEIQEVSNRMLSTAFDEWGLMLLKGGISWADLGFMAY